MLLNAVFCSANCKIRLFGNEWGSSTFKNYFKGVKSSYCLFHSPPRTFSFFGQFSVRKPLYFYTQKKLFMRLGSKGSVSCSCCQRYQYTHLRLIKWLIFIWYFPSWETQKHFFFFFKLKLQKETSSVSLWCKEEAGHRDTSEQIRTEGKDNTIFNQNCLGK